MSNVTWQDEMACDITFNVADDVAKNFRHQFVLSYCWCFHGLIFKLGSFGLGLSWDTIRFGLSPLISWDVSIWVELIMVPNFFFLNLLYGTLLVGPAYFDRIILLDQVNFEVLFTGDDRFILLVNTCCNISLHQNIIQIAYLCWS